MQPDPSIDVALTSTVRQTSDPARDNQPKVPRAKRFPPVVANVPSINASDGPLGELSAMAALHKCVMTVDRRSLTVRITPSSLEGWAAVIEAFAALEEAEYHTYGTPQERRASKKVIVKGFFAGDFTEFEIQANVRESWGLQLERFVPLNNSAAVLIFAGDTDMRDIKSMNTLMYQRVKVEPYKVKPTAVTQCKRCLEFGHVKQHCGRTPREPYYVDTDEDGNESTDPALRCCTKCRYQGIRPSRPNVQIGRAHV